VADSHTAHGYWLHEAGPVDPVPALAGEEHADVAIVGGGYTGMWTAWHVTELEPDARVALVEADVCGRGPSGRNGGFVNGLWFSLPNMRRRFGDAAAIEVARAAQAAVDGIGDFCGAEGVNAWFRQDGYLQVSTSPAWDGQWDEAVAACRDLGEPEAARELSPKEVRERCDSPVCRGGVFYPEAATVQPARLAQELRTRLLERGVAIHERSRVRRVDAGGNVVETPGGRIRAAARVLAAGARLAALKPLRRRLTLTSSHMVITEPVPDYLDEIGWTGGECITDSRAMLHYFRTTPDGRIAFGWGGGRVVWDTATRGRAEVDPGVTSEVERYLLRFFPGLAGRRIEHAWGGPIDVSPSHLPVITSLDPSTHCAFGYTGHGVGPSFMVGRALASLALDRRDEASRLAIVEPPLRRVPPEPFRYAGGTIVRNALLRKETAMEEGRRPGLLDRAIAATPELIGIHIGR
jgi:glycine/D-amino acid oxidase-like deaminating enzyme